MSFLAELERVLEGGVEVNAALSARTSVRVGGAADVLAHPETEEALAKALDVCAQHAVPFTVLGGGANTIVADAGVRGVVFKLSARMVQEASVVDGDVGTVRLGAGAPIARIVSLARENGLVGTEFLAGIPGTVGGAVAMNAGTRHGSVEQIVEEIGIVEPSRARTLSRAEIGFGYRRTALPEHAVIVWAKFRVPVGEPAKTRQLMDDDLAYRRRTQPLSLPNSGSVFRNPPGEFAGRLIQDCGLKGKRNGDAQLSELHGNFIVNRGRATAADVVGLMRLAQDAVEERFNVLLVPEVKLVGEFDEETLPRGRESRGPGC